MIPPFSAAFSPLPAESGRKGAGFCKSIGIEPDEPQEHQNELELTQLRLEHERQDNERKDRLIVILGSLALIFGGRCIVMDINSHAVGFYRGTWDTPAIVSMTVMAAVAAGIAGLIIYNFRQKRRRKK